MNRKLKPVQLPSALPPCVPLDCSKRQYAHLATNPARKFITLTSRK